MIEDFSALVDGYAVYLPAMQEWSAKQIVKEDAMRTSGTSPKTLKMADLNWLDPHNAHWRYKYCLASAAAFMGEQIDNAINTAHEGTVVFGDSAGYQIGTGALPELREWLAFKESPELIIEKWQSTDLPIRIMRWLETYCDYGMTIDMPLWAQMQTRENTPFHYLSEQQLISLTISNLELMSNRRDRQSRCKFLNYEFEGWALGGEVGARGGIRRVLRRLLILRDQGLLDPPRSWCHVLGVSTTIWAVCLTAIQRAIRDGGNPDFSISFDSASPFKAAGLANLYATMPTFGKRLEDWIIRTAKLPTGYSVANSATLRAFPASSPLADFFNLQDLNPRTGAFEPKTMDTLGDQLLINHNVYVYVKAMIEANNAVFVKGVAPKPLLDAVSIINELCRARDWQTAMDRYADELDSVTAQRTSESDEN